MSEKERYIELIHRYLNHEIEDSELALLIQWTKSSPANQKELEEYRRAYEMSSRYVKSEISQIEIDKEWNILASRIQYSSFADYGNKTTRRKTFIFYAAAASLVLFLTVGALIWSFFPAHPLVTASGNNVLKTNLPDGTNISLNTQSEISYNQDFNKEKREVNLRGNAYFEVQHNAHKPFVVNTEGVSIEVIGTKFMVEQSDSGVVVAVSEGKVKVSTKDNPGKNILLEKDENTFVNFNGKEIEKKQGNSPNIISWSTGKLTFDNTPLKEVIRDIERTYGKKIILKNPSAGECLLTVSFENEKPETVLKVIENTLDIEITEKDSILYIEGRGCSKQ